MARKERDYSNMRETERVRDAVKINRTHVKDYSLKNIIEVSWQFNEPSKRLHLVEIKIGDHKLIANTTLISRAIHDLIKGQDEHDWLPRGMVSIVGAVGKLTIDTTLVNKECLRDHVAKVTIEECESIIDLEELLKAIRYG